MQAAETRNRFVGYQNPVCRACDSVKKSYVCDSYITDKKSVYAGGGCIPPSFPSRSSTGPTCPACVLESMCSVTGKTVSTLHKSFYSFNSEPKHYTRDDCTLQRCTDTSDLRHFRPKTFRHHLHFVYRSVTLRKITSLMTNDTYFSTFYRPTTSLKFFVQGMQHTTELAWPLLYHGDANANIFVSSLLTAVAFLRFPTYYVCCQQCVTAHTQCCKSRDNDLDLENLEIQIVKVLFSFLPSPPKS